MKLFETDRLVVRRLGAGDAEFMLDLLNQPSFLKFIGDRGVKTLDNARTYTLERYCSGYEDGGFGGYGVELRKSGELIGVTSLLKRDEFEDVDVGFAFLPDFWRQGFATESGIATVEYGFSALALERIIAMTQADNIPSIKTLKKMGLKFEGVTHLAEEGINLQLYAIERTPS